MAINKTATLWFVVMDPATGDTYPESLSEAGAAALAREMRATTRPHAVARSIVIDAAAIQPASWMLAMDFGASRQPATSF